jgi:hypothetical protein
MINMKIKTTRKSQEGTDRNKLPVNSATHTHTHTHMKGKNK